MRDSVLLQSDLPLHCAPINSFLLSVSTSFGTCIPTPLAFVSTLLGYLSILSWLFAQMPQIFKNFHLKSTAGLSAFFLVEWLLGDLCNLLGALFTEQATWQIIVAAYYVFVDICLVYQFFWYTYILPWWNEGIFYSSGSDTDDDDDASSDLINSLSPINSSFHEDQTSTVKDASTESSKFVHTRSVETSRFTSANFEKGVLQSPPVLAPQSWTGAGWHKPSPRTLMYTATLSSLMTQAVASPVGIDGTVNLLQIETPLQFAGRIISWCSTVLYLGSRLPQLYKNWQRQSTAGLSPLLFIAAFCGNLFYSTSMLTNPKLWYNMGPHGGQGWVGQDGSRRRDYVADGAPFFLGAFLVLFMDGTMFVQFKLYGERKEKVVKIRDGSGIGRWQKVNGWMRGWIPSIQRERVVDLSESQRLLSENRDSDRHHHHSQYGTVQ